MKIAYVIECMYNSGGMERVLSVCANNLCHELDVSIITLFQKGMTYYFPLDEKIHCYDLGLDDVANRDLLKERMLDFLMSHHYDFVVSLGGIDMYYLHSMNDGSKKLLWLHFAIDIAKTTWLGHNPSLLKRIKGWLVTWKRIYHAKQYSKIIVLSKTDLKAWEKYTQNAILIYNPITIDSPILSDNNTKKVLSVGRLDYEKGFDYLIDAWEIVNKKHPDWFLDIYGEGPLRKQLQDHIDSLDLSDSIKLCGRTKDIIDVYVCHSLFVMCSRTEGLPLVLLEASSCALPLVAFDCPSGPREIIENGKNGLLVEHVGDIKGMADSICTLIENEPLRNEMGEKARQMVEKFSVPNITKQWMLLFNGLIEA